MTATKSRSERLLALASTMATVAAAVSIALLVFVWWAHHYRRGWMSGDVADQLLGATSILNVYVAVVMVLEGRARKARKAAIASSRAR